MTEKKLIEITEKGEEIWCQIFNEDGSIWSSFVSEDITAALEKAIEFIKKASGG